MHAQQWETVFFMGSVRMSFLKGEERYEFSSEASVEHGHGKFVVDEE
jgi:hypothetical protein